MSSFRRFLSRPFGWLIALGRLFGLAVPLAWATLASLLFEFAVAGCALVAAAFAAFAIWRSGSPPTCMSVLAVVLFFGVVAGGSPSSLARSQLATGSRRSCRAPRRWRSRAPEAASATSSTAPAMTHGGLPEERPCCCRTWSRSISTCPLYRGTGRTYFRELHLRQRAAAEHFHETRPESARARADRSLFSSLNDLRGRDERELWASAPINPKRGFYISIASIPRPTMPPAAPGLLARINDSPITPILSFADQQLHHQDRALANAAGRVAGSSCRHLLTVVDGYLYDSGRIDTTLPFERIPATLPDHVRRAGGDGAPRFLAEKRRPCRPCLT